MYMALQPAQTNLHTTLDLYFLETGSLGEKYCPIFTGQKSDLGFYSFAKGAGNFVKFSLK